MNHFETDLRRANEIRLRAEVHIVADRLRRHLLAEYKAAYDESLAAGTPLDLRADPAAIDGLALRAAQSAFGGGKALGGGA